MEACPQGFFALLAACSVFWQGVQCSIILGCTDEKRAEYPSGWPAQLDYGLYWWGPDNTFEKATASGSKFYDPSKPTVIDAHGWLGFLEWTKACFRTSTHCDICGDRRQMFKSWFEKGWNVGLFYWDQFADEPHACDAEMKLYFNHKKLRWLSNSPRGGPNYLAKTQWREFTDENQTVADLCANNIAEVMHNYSGPEVRMIGHSMGTQLVIRCAAILHDMKARAAPKRMVLTEAAFVPPKAFGDWYCGNVKVGGMKYAEYAARTATETYKKLHDYGVFTEYIQTLKGRPRIVVDGRESVALQMQSVAVQYTPSWCHNNRTSGIAHWLPVLCTHDASHAEYMFSMGNTGPCVAPNAACSVSEIQLLVNAARKANGGGGHPTWVQTSGTETISTHDDGFGIRYDEDTDDDSQSDDDYIVESDGQSPPAMVVRFRQAFQQRTGSIALAAVACSCLILVVCGMAAVVRRKSSQKRSTRSYQKV